MAVKITVHYEPVSVSDNDDNDASKARMILAKNSSYTLQPPSIRAELISRSSNTLPDKDHCQRVVVDRETECRWSCPVRSVSLTAIIGTISTSYQDSKPRVNIVAVFDSEEQSAGGDGTAKF